MTRITFVLADGSVISIVGWSFVLIGLLLAGFFAVSRLRHWMKSDDLPGGIGFTLSDLRQLHRQGKMTDQEFEKARSMMLQSAKAMAEKLPDPLAGSRRSANASTRPGGTGNVLPPSSDPKRREID